MTETVSSKFYFVESIKIATNSLIDIINNVGNVPKLNIDVGATKYTDKTTISIDFSWYKQFKPFGDLVITGFVYAFYLWRMFIKLPGIISGASGGLEILGGYNESKIDNEVIKDRWRGRT